MIVRWYESGTDDGSITGTPDTGMFTVKSVSWIPIAAADDVCWPDDVPAYVSGREACKAWVRAMTLKLHSRPQYATPCPAMVRPTLHRGLLNQPGFHRKGRFCRAHSRLEKGKAGK